MHHLFNSPSHLGAEAEHWLRSLPGVRTTAQGAGGNPSQAGLLVTPWPAPLLLTPLPKLSPQLLLGPQGWGDTNQATPPCAPRAASPPQCPPLLNFLLTWTSVFNPSLRPTSSTKPSRPHSIPKGLRDVCFIHHQAGYSRDHGKPAVPPSLAQTDTTPPGPQMRTVTTGCHCPGSAAPLKVV